MPLDGHSYLLSQGWTGKGTGLRHGAITRPLAIPQKKTLAGLGKDRDEAFPFWDHLFSAAAKSIQLKIISDDEEEESDPATLEPIKRTATGILSNRRPVTGTPASTSGTNTPDTGDQGPRSSLLCIAKREAARRGLYARFFRGPILGPESDNQNDSEVINAGTSDVMVQDGADLQSEEGKLAKRACPGDYEDDERRRRKRQKKELREKQKEEQKASKKSVCKGKEKALENQEVRDGKKRRKREAEVGEDLSRKKKRKEKKLKVQVTLELDEEGTPEISQDRPMKKKRRRKSEDGSGRIPQLDEGEWGG